MEKLIIRKVEKKDAAEICKINAEGLGGTDDLSLVQGKIEKLDPAREAAFVAEADGQVLGVIHIERYDLLYSETMANVLGLSVMKEFH
ncbi:MAG: hypothetical protein J5817_09880, partial [Treponema sp.]|nr:hypothetical protein [Treponema sp.]